MYVIAGLGNPGREFAETRHNLGFITLDRLAERIGAEIKKKKFKALVGETMIGSERVLLVKPQTYMNLSGQSIGPIVDYYRLEHERLIVVYDDLDLAVGTVRVRPRGSAGTHNGMRSVVQMVGDGEFPRVRIGIGDHGEIDIKDYVLSGFTKAEVPLLEEAVDRAVDACISIITEGVDRAMNQYNGTA